MAEGWVQEDNEALVMQMLDEFIAAHADTIDTDRIYIQGLSMGGYGTDVYKRQDVGRRARLRQMGQPGNAAGRLEPRWRVLGGRVLF